MDVYFDVFCFFLGYQLGVHYDRGERFSIMVFDLVLKCSWFCLGVVSRTVGLKC